MIYFGRLGSDGPVKIGFTKNLKRRLPFLQTACPAPIAIIREIEGTLETERWLHEYFDALRQHGEWFTYTDEMLAVVPTIEPPKPLDCADPLLAVVEKFLIKSGMKPTTFGRNAAGDPSFVFRLRRGRDLRRKTREKVSQYIRAHAPGRAAA